MRIHPTNPDIVFAGVMGDLYKPTQERGVYKSTDGGTNWKKVLFSNENAGVVDLIIDPNNPRINAKAALLLLIKKFKKFTD